MRLRHLAIIVRDIGTVEKIYAGRIGLLSSGRTTVPGERITVSFIPVGTAQIELFEPLAPESPLAKFLAAHGPSIHHIALEVPDLGRAMARARNAGFRLIDPAPRSGAHGTRVAFVHPAEAYGVLVELVERPSVGYLPDSSK
jgi:methylmalonyl-CoA/ethylmalonyl-CoA epimerase